MNPKLECMTWQSGGTFNEHVNAAIMQEDVVREVLEDECKRKVPIGTPAGPPPKYQLVYMSPSE